MPFSTGAATSSILAHVDVESWPPPDDDDLPYWIMIRLKDALKEITDVRGTSWARGRAQVGVWPYNEQVVAAVAERLAPLEADVYSQPTIPRAM